MLSRRLLRTLLQTNYVLLVLIIIVATGLSCAALLSQTVRTSPTQSWHENFNTLVIGASYIIVLVTSLLFCIKRRIAIRLKLSRISKTYRTIGRGGLPHSVHKYVAQEYIRACLISYESLPKDIHHQGWGRPGTKNSEVRFKHVLLDTLPHIDGLAHVVIPLLPNMKPHSRLLLHFRFLHPLLPVDEDGMTPLHYYDAAIQIARNASMELTEEEFEMGMTAAETIEKCLNDCRLEMLEDSSSATQFDVSTE